MQENQELQGEKLKQISSTSKHCHRGVNRKFENGTESMGSFLKKKNEVLEFFKLLC